MDTDAKRIALLGLPNTGKSRVYNELTGTYTLVANYPLTTVEAGSATITHRGAEYEITDTPGLHSLFIHSEEEHAVRDALYAQPPDGIVQCIDANRFRQSLMLTLDLIELGIPFGIVLNVVDETERAGREVDARRLSATLGVPVYDHRRRGERGDKLRVSFLDELAVSSFEVSYGEGIEAVVDRLEAELAEGAPNGRFTRKSALLVAEGERQPIHGVTDRVDRIQIDEIRASYRGNLPRDITAKRRGFVDAIVAMTTDEVRATASRFSLEFARIARHPILGLPLLGAIVVLTYLLVVHVAGLLEGTLSSLLVDPAVEGIAGAIGSDFLRDLLVGPYGILTLGIFNAFVTVLPILSAFFLMMGFVEDVGYLPNLSVLTRRVLGKIGLSGRSVMSLVLGFGCKTMATLTTRGIASRRERLITIYLIAFAIPCSAQLAIDMAILGRVGFVAFLIAYGTLALVEIGAGFILNKILPDEERSEFIQELPPIRMPNPWEILKKTGYRLYWFLKEAVPIFLIASVVLFLIDFIGLLDAMKHALNPVVTGWLGLPIDTVEVLILSLARHEAAAGLLLRMVDSGALDYIQSIVAVVITTMFVPCFANIVAMCKQVGVARGLLMTVVINLSSFLFAGILRWILVAVM